MQPCTCGLGAGGPVGRPNGLVTCGGDRYCGTGDGEGAALSWRPETTPFTRDGSNLNKSPSKPIWDCSMARKKLLDIFHEKKNGKNRKKIEKNQEKIKKNQEKSGKSLKVLTICLALWFCLN